MKELILRQAQLKDYETFLHIRTTANSSLLYGYSSEEEKKNLFTRPNEKEEIMESFLKAHKPVDLYEEYREDVNNIFFIIADGQFVGYIAIKKERKKVRIIDLALINDDIISEFYFNKIFTYIFNKTKTDEIYLLCFPNFLGELIKQIGFSSSDGILYSKKVIGR